MQPENSYVEPTLTPQDIPGGGINPNQTLNPGDQTPPPVVPPTPSANNGGPNKRILILLGVVVVLILLSIGAFFVYRIFVTGNQTVPSPSTIPTIVATATPYVVPTLTPISSSSPSASPVASNSASITGEGTIVGMICYPSEAIPAGKVIAKDTAKNTTISFDNPQNNSNFLINLPAGSYKLKYDPSTGSDGYYTTCTGTESVCQNNTTKRASIVTTVVAGQTANGIKICDYYYQAGMEPDF